MRILATLCFAFAAGIGAAQYLLSPQLASYGAAGFALLGALALLLLPKGGKLRWTLILLGLAAGLGYDAGYHYLVQRPYEALVGRTETFVLECADYPDATDDGGRVTVRVRERGLYGKAVYYGGAETLSLKPGDRVRVSVRVASSGRIHDADVTTFTARGVYALLYGKGEAETIAEKGSALAYLPQRMARCAEEAIEVSFPERTRPFFRAILLGDRSMLETEDGTALSEAGLYHVTAVSGLHCAFLFSIVSVLVGRHRQRLVSAILIPLLIFYALVVGAPPSVVRACIMLILVLLAPLFNRESDGLTSLSFALALILLANPCAVKGISLQLSFAAMAGVTLVTPRLYAAASPRRAWSRAVLSSLCATAGALVFTAPLTAFYFNQLPLLSPLSNLIGLWAASAAFMLGFLTVLLALVAPGAAAVAGLAAHVCALAFLYAAHLVAAIPYHAIYFSNSYLKFWLVYVYAMAGACLIARRGRGRWLMTAALAGATLVLVVRLNAMPLRGGSLHMIALDVGQGQCVVLHSQGHTALVDCGTSSYASAGDIAADYLQSIGVSKLDCVVISHYHADHCNGLPVLLSRLRCDRLVLPDIEEDDILRVYTLGLAEHYNIPVDFVRSTRELPLGDAALTVYPPCGAGEMNEEGITALCTTGRFDVLLTGDMDARTEESLLDAHRLPDIEVLMVGHHGSRYSTGETLLRSVRPEVGVVSCGVNSYGHPHPDALARLSAAGTTVYRTDEQGNIHITVN